MASVLPVDIEASDVASVAISRMRSAGSMRAAAESMGLIPQSLAHVLQREDPDGYRSALDDLEVARLSKTGLECPNECGLVYRERICPECGTRVTKRNNVDWEKRRRERLDARGSR